MKFYRDTTEIYDIRPEYGSTQHVVHMGENVLNLTFKTTSVLDLRINDFAVFEDEKYKLKQLVSPTRVSADEFLYTMKMMSPQYDLQDALYVLEDSSGVGILDDTIPLFGTALFHLEQIVRCAKVVHPEWVVGDVEEPGEGKNITYTDMDCLEALQHMCTGFNIEYWITGTAISLGKKKFGLPILFRYGIENTLYDLNRSNQDGRIVTKLLVKGSDRNIDSSEYGNKFLHLPDNERYVEQNVDKFGVIMGRVSFADVFPRLIHKQPTDPGSVTSVRVDDNGIYYIKDAYLDFEPELLPGKNIVVDFQTGQLGGVKIDANWHADAHEFELIRGDYGLGQDIPASIFVPAAGDLYLLSELKMPQAYIDAAERELLERGQEAIAQMCEQKVSYKGTVNKLYFRQLNERIETGRAVVVEDAAIVDTGSVELRVQSFTRPVNDDEAGLDIEISDTLYVSRIDRDENALQEVKIDTDARIRYGDAYTRRRWRDAEETSEMLKDAQLNFAEAISPIVVQTMQALVGDRSLQFRFVNSKTNPVQISYMITYNKDTKILRCPTAILQHMTLGINTVSSSHVATEYKFWDMSMFESAPLTESAKKYYLYARVSRTGTTGTFLLSENSIAMEGVAGYYHLLTGVLNSEFEGERSFVRLYGFTEILPGQVFTDVISDPGRNIIIDLIAREIIARNGAKIIGQMIFESGTSGYDNITDRPNLSDWADVIISDAAALDAALKNVIDNNLVNAINASSLGVREILATSLGYANYNDLAAKAQQGKTIVDGGLIRTSLIDAEAIVAKWVTAEVIASLNIVTSRLTVTNGAKIGGFNIVGSALSATSDLGAFILMWPGDNKTKLSLGRDATNFNALGYNSLMGEIVNRNVRPEYNSSTIALILSAMGELSGETYRNKNYALVANGGAYIGGSLCVFDEVEFNVDIDASMLLKCRKFIYSPTSTKNVYLPGRAAIEALFQSGLSRGGSSPGYMWSGKSVGYQSWIELDILVTRYATANVLVSSPVSGTDLVDNDGNVISSREMAKGDIITYCYYNNSWYMKVHN